MDFLFLMFRRIFKTKDKEYEQKPPWNVTELELKFMPILA